MGDYTGYAEWKNWGKDKFFVEDPHEKLYLPSHFQGIPLNGVKFLEIGFGNASKLAWARGQGADIYGTEVQSSLLELARARGIKLLKPDLSDLNEQEGSFDVIVAFDVFEHIRMEQLIELLRSIERALKVGGVLVARFPNGQSPFGSFIQFSDATHINIISPAIMEQLLSNGRLRVEYAGIPVWTNGSLFSRSSNVLRGSIRRVVDFLICRLYGVRPPLDPNIVLRIRKM